jgi:hypothetical protein
VSDYRHEYLADALYDVKLEGLRARDKFGDQFDATDLEWLAILTEELGEVAMEVTKNCVRPLTQTFGYLDRLRAEVIQVAAVAARWVEAIDRK